MVTEVMYAYQYLTLCICIFPYADQLVCINRDCTSDEECVTSYEVCSENPVYENETVVRFTCHALFLVNSNTSVTTTSQQCLNDPHSPCPVNCKLSSLPLSDTTTLHDCCCTGNLCNDVKLELNGTGTLICVWSVHICVCHQKKM